MTWTAFSDLVETLLGIDKDRVGAEAYTPAMIRQGVIELQMLVDGYKLNHETLYVPSDDLVLEGMASRGVKPPQSAIRDVWLCESWLDDDDDRTKSTRYLVERCNWQDRFSLIHGTADMSNGRGLYCVDPQGYTFYIYPGLDSDDWVVSMHWDGLKIDFADAEETQLDEACALAVAEFVKAKIAREIDHDTPTHDSYMRTSRMKMQQLWVGKRDEREGLHG